MTSVIKFKQRINTNINDTITAVKKRIKSEIYSKKKGRLRSFFD